MALPEANSRGHSLYLRNFLCSADGTVGPTTCVRDHLLRWQVTCLCRMERRRFWKQIGFSIAFTHYRRLAHSGTRARRSRTLLCRLSCCLAAERQPHHELHTSTLIASRVSTSRYVQSYKIAGHLLDEERYAVSAFVLELIESPSGRINMSRTIGKFRQSRYLTSTALTHSLGSTSRMFYRFNTQKLLGRGHLTCHCAGRTI
jgi:hypothetical protein